MITREIIDAGLNTAWAGRSVIYYEKTDSTNTRAKLLAKEGAVHGTLVVAEQQTAGRGRRGRDWVSPAGDAIYMSLLLKAEIKLENISMLTLLTALSVVKAIEQIESNADCKIKWPNDIILNQKKVCGILTELVTEQDASPCVVIGIGINVNADEFSEEISEVATSIKRESGRRIDRAQLISAVLNQFEKYYNLFIDTQNMSAMVDQYNSRLIHMGQQVYIQTEQNRQCVTALGINERGALIVEDAQGNKDYLISGEVSVRGIYGYV